MDGKKGGNKLWEVESSDVKKACVRREACTRTATELYPVCSDIPQPKKDSRDSTTGVAQLISKLYDGKGWGLEALYGKWTASDVATQMTDDNIDECSFLSRFADIHHKEHIVDIYWATHKYISKDGAKKFAEVHYDTTDKKDLKEKYGFTTSDTWAGVNLPDVWEEYCWVQITHFWHAWDNQDNGEWSPDLAWHQYDNDGQPGWDGLDSSQVCGYAWPPALLIRELCPELNWKSAWTSVGRAAQMIRETPSCHNKILQARIRATFEGETETRPITDWGPAASKWQSEDLPVLDATKCVFDSLRWDKHGTLHGACVQILPTAGQSIRTCEFGTYPGDFWVGPACIPLVWDS